MPPVNLMRLYEADKAEETWLPTDLLYCDKCELVQLDYIADSNVVFPPSYPYTSGSTRILRDNFMELAREAKALCDLNPGDVIFDIGSNDGTLLKNFVPAYKVLGIEPTDVADLAVKNGIPTVKQFFNRETANFLRDNYEKPKLITCANCFAHMPNIHGVIEGIVSLLAPDGVFVSESHYLISLIEKLQYDTIYHEHLRYYSLTSLTNLLKSHGLNIFKAKRIATHGGSIRVYAKRNANGQSLDISLFAEPTDGKMHVRLKRFAADVSMSRLKLLNRLYSLKRDNKRICGISAPSRASTVVNYCRLDNSLIDYVVEIEGSLKIGKCMPGTDIPVLDEEFLFQYQPDYAILFSWHIADELIPKLRDKGYRGEFILPCERDIDEQAQAA